MWNINAAQIDYFNNVVECSDVKGVTRSREPEEKHDLQEHPRVFPHLKLAQRP